MGAVNAAHIRDFASRDWRSSEPTEPECRLTPSAAIEQAAGLYEYVRTLKPDWPNAAEREADLASHIRLAGMLQRASQDRAR
jgi:hypothetical protein